MPKKKYHLNNPFFNEFVFLVILSAPQELKNKLPLELLKFTTTVEKIKGFADRASLEMKLEMVSRLGGAFSLTVHPPGYLNKEKLDEIVTNFLNNRRSADVDDMIENKVFVQTDREIMAIHSIMAMNCHSSTYMLNRDYSILAAKVSSGAEINPKINDIEHVKGVMEDHRLLCKVVMFILLNQNFIDMAGYKTKELLILLYLFINRNSYMAISDIHAFFRTTYTAQIVNRTVYRLAASMHVNQFPRTYKYAITGLGIQVIAGFVNRVMNQAIYF